jgi:predicted Zn finger-like uncharacterized protein
MAGFLDMETEIGDLGWRLAGASDSTVMILTCPECATSYFVDDDRIPAAGRTVKCSSCGVRWLAKPTVTESTASTTSPDEAAPAGSAAALAGGAPEPPFVSTVAPKARRAGKDKASSKTGSKDKAGAGSRTSVTAVAGVALAAVLVAGLVVFRGGVVRLWPGTAAAYATVGLSVAPPGLVIEGVNAEPAFAFGRPVLSVTGQVRNTAHKVQDIPPLRIRLLDGSGKLVAVKTARPQNPQAPPGARRYFRIAFEDPPKGVHDLEVTFAPAVRSSHPAAEAPPQPPPPPPASAPALQEAKPLPPGSPDALPEHG